MLCTTWFVWENIYSWRSITKSFMNYIKIILDHNFLKKLHDFDDIKIPLWAWLKADLQTQPGYTHNDLKWENLDSKWNKVSFKNLLWPYILSLKQNRLFEQIEGRDYPVLDSWNHSFDNRGRHVTCFWCLNHGFISH